MSHAWDDLRDAMSGRSTEDVRARISASLHNDQDATRHFADGCRDVSVPLFGSAPPAIVVSQAWFHVSYAVFWVCWYSIGMAWHFYYPVRLDPVRMFLGIALSILASAWFCFILHRKLSKQLLYSGPGVRGTLSEAIIGAAFGTGVWWLLSSIGVIEGVLAASLRSNRAWLIVIASIPALYGLTAGFGFRERVAQSAAPLHWLWSVGIRRFVIVWPWFAGIGWFCGYMTGLTTAPLSLAGLHLEWTWAGIVVATVADILLSAQLCMSEGELKGTLKGALSATLIFVLFIGVGSIPLIVAIRWAIGSIEGMRTAILVMPYVLMYGVYCGFGVGATQAALEWEYIRQRLQLFALSALAGTITSMSVALVIDFILAGWGPAARPIALVIGFWIFIRVFDAIEERLMMRLKPNINKDGDVLRMDLQGAMIRPVLVGPPMILEYLRCVVESLKTKGRWQMAR